MGMLTSAALWALIALVGAPVLLSLVPIDQMFAPFDPGSIKGKRVLVCGASSGIGEQIAYKYAELGAHVALVARRKPFLEKVAAAARLKGAASAHVISADLSSQQGLTRTVEAAIELKEFGGGFDVLILNHAIQRWGWLLPESADVPTTRIGGLGKEWDFEFLDSSVQVNFVSFAKLAVLSMPALVRGAGNPGARSQIIVVSSGAGKLAVPKAAIYSGAKHALHGFFDSLRLEIEDKRLPVTVTTCIVGQIETETAVSLISEDISMPMARPDDTAAALIQAGAAGLEELYTPVSQGLHVVAILRPLKLFRHLLDRVTLLVMGGRNVYLG